MSESPGESMGQSHADSRISAAGPIVQQAPTAVAELVAEPLARVESLFHESLRSDVSIVSDLGAFVGEGGGKRLRPTLHLLAAKMCGYAGPHDVLLATVLEFIHNATLVHDDVIDEADTRRGRPAVHRRFGNHVSVLFGDYLLAKAMSMALRAESLPVMESLADVTLRMTEGEMLQTRLQGRLDLTVDEYLDLIERKTAWLFARCCELAGRLAGVDEERRAALERYGLHLGLEFQLVDDLLDFTGDVRRLGKPVFGDLREGKTTLAVIELLEGGGEAAERQVRAVMDGGGLREAEALAAMLEDSGAIERTRERARQHASLAIVELDAFADSPAKGALRQLPERLLHRDR